MDITRVPALQLNTPLLNTSAKTSGAESQVNFRDVLSSTAQDDGTKIKNAAKQFEGLLLGQMLKSMHESSEGGVLGTSDDQAASTAMEMAYESVAQSMAAHGGLGLAKFVEKGLATKPKISAQ